MASLLTTPENSELFHRIRKGPLFPQILLTLDSHSGVKTGWARCCGFNLNKNKVFALPLHASFALESEQEAGNLVLACPEAGLSLHLTGTFVSLSEPSLVTHFWKKLEPIVEVLRSSPEQLLEFQVESAKKDRFYQD